MGSVTETETPGVCVSVLVRMIDNIPLANMFWIAFL